MDKLYGKLDDKILFASKGKHNLPKNIKNEIKMISIDYDEINVIGSFNYKIQKFPADLDLLETFTFKRNKKYTKEFVKGIKKIVKDYEESKEHYFLELKCGLDHRFFIFPGVLENGNYIPSQSFKQKIESLVAQNLLTKEEEKKLFEHYDKKDLQSFYDITDILRKHYIIRWNYEEIRSGKKMLPGDKILTLEEALFTGGKVNVEALININGLINDISNFFILILQLESGKRLYINFGGADDQTMPHIFIESLKEGILEVNLNFSPFKMIKRMWSLGRLTKDKEMLEKLQPIISSYISFLTQIKANFNALKKFLESKYDLPIGLGTSTLEIIKNKLNNVVLEDDKVLADIFKNVDKISKMVENKVIKSKKDKNEIIKKIEKIKKPLDFIINSISIDFLINIGFIRKDILKEFYEKYKSYPLIKVFYPKVVYEYYFNPDGSMK